MRASPTSAFSNQSYNNSSGFTMIAADPGFIQMAVLATAAGFVYATATLALSADL
jgi:hypothetical protein